MCSFKIFKSKEFLNNNVQIFIFIYLFTNCLQIFIYFAAIDDKPSSSSEEAVVYGNWKPEHPAKPEEMETEVDPDQRPKERVYGKLEAMLMGMPADGKI